MPIERWIECRSRADQASVEGIDVLDPVFLLDA